MKNKVMCALCDAPANMYCDSDRASLCWRCDNKVHGANFLVAKHNRCVLCHNCQGVTPWSASGPILPPSMSMCLSCVSSRNNNHDHATQSHVNNRGDDEDEDEDEDGDEESSFYGDEEEYSDEGEDEDEDENQVVPLTLENGVTPSSMEISGCSCSSNDETGEEDGSNSSSHNLTVLPSVSLKRSREMFLSN